MKSFTISSLVAVLPALASASPVIARQAAQDTFTLRTVNSGTAVQNGQVNANSGLLWVGKPTSTFCPEAAADCPAGNTSVFYGSYGSTGIATSHEAPGLQSLYIQGPEDPTPGALSFNQAHTAAPADSAGTFNLTTSELVYPPAPFYACPSEGAYFITVEPQGDFCISVVLATDAYTGPTPAAWQYQ